MRAIESEIEKEHQPAVSRDTGNLLSSLVAASGGHRVLEVGTNLGYGCLWMARGLAPDGRIDTIEIDPKLVARAKKRFDEAGLGGKIEIHQGAALDVLPRLTGPYDFIFLDCVKEEYVAYLAHAKRLARRGGIIAADNVLWSGRVWSGDAQETTRGILDYTAAIRGEPKLLSAILPVGDGLSISVLR